jgi:hypothetical protein
MDGACLPGRSLDEPAGHAIQTRLVVEHLTVWEEIRFSPAHPKRLAKSFDLQ